MEIEQHAKEGVVQHLALCKRKIGELEAALHGQVQGGEGIPGVDEEVIVMKPKVYTVIIPIDRYEEYKKSQCTVRPRLSAPQITGSLTIRIISC